MRMEASGANSDAQRGISSTSNNIGSNSRRHGVQLSAANLFRSPLSTLLEYSGILRTRSSHTETDSLINSQFQPRLDDAGTSPASPGGSGEVSIRIIGAGEQERDRVGNVVPSPAVGGTLREGDGENEVFGRTISRSASAASVGALESQSSDRGAGDGVTQQVNGNTETGTTDGAGVNNRESSYQRYDIQQAARWIEQIIPFSLLLLIVFIRQHLQGFFVTILIAAVMFKSNDIVKKQTALKGERKISILIGICILFSSYLFGFYWWYRNDDLLSPLLMLPPKAIPPFWHAIFMIMVNDTLVRQAAMVFKCFLLMYYKNSRGRNYRRQGQLLTLVEYLLLLEDVDKLKKKLRHEENIHRALERAFYRPLGTLPRLPPYLPKYTLELLAEVAVLEEEVVRLEEQVVNYRQGLYQEAVSICSRRITDDNHLSDSCPQLHGKVSKQRHSRSFSMSEVNLGSSVPHSSLSLDRSASSRKLFLKESVFGSSRISYDVTSNSRQAVMKSCNDSLIDGLRKENHSAESCTKDKPSPQKQVNTIKTSLVRPPVKPESMSKIADVRVQCRVVEQAQESYLASLDERESEAESTENKISEDILKCLSSILLRLSTSKGKIANPESFRSLGAKVLNESNGERELQDPYCICSELRKQDIGEYRYILNIDANSVNLNRKMNASFLIHRLKILLDKLSSVKLEGLTHHQKLAFWINTYNSCVMNAFIEHGIPETAEQIVSLMQKATINVGGHFLNAIMIEHFILRLPYHLKYTCSKSAKDNELKVRSVFGLEWSEPLVTFALSCGSWSSPAVRVYTASQVETQLETAKRDYLQAAVGISATNKLIIPKLLDWYLLDFAKDLDALLDWVCLQLPDELRNHTMKCLERRGREPLSQLVQVMPYNFSFRYLIHQ